MPKTSTARVLPFRTAPAKDETTGRFLPGNTGGNGRPAGARSKLGEAFVSALFDDWEANGVDAIVRMREADQAAYVRIVAGLLPKHVAFDEPGPIAGLSDEQLERLITALLPAET